MAKTPRPNRLVLEPLELRLALSGDSTVVFNEIMYNPAAFDQRLEWVELYNQLAVDMDLSGWRLDGGIEFEFASGTVIPGGGHLVIAKDPVRLELEAGFADALGPFGGQLSNGGEQIDLVNNSGRLMDALEYDDEDPWPVSPDGSGASLAKIAPFSASRPTENWAASGHVGGTPGGRNFLDPMRPSEIDLAFNEVAAAGEVPFWLELANYGDASIQLDGYVIAGRGGRQHALPAQVIPPGGLVSVTEAQLGFGVGSGDKLYLYTPDLSYVVDGVMVGDSLSGRLPDGTGRWLIADAATPGAANRFALRDEIVINEIMYHHSPTPETFGVELRATETIEQRVPFAEDREEWIELYNRSAVSVDLSGWKLADGVEYEFPQGTTIGPGQYLVVAKDAEALRENYPAINIIGNYSRRLSDFGDGLVLRDEIGNPADEVHYFEGGRWPQFADGGGSSLELRNPNADNSAAEAYAASDEGSKSTWQTYSYRAVAADPPGSNNPAHFQEFIFGLLDAGEILIDDISVVEDPEGAATEFIQNGSFTTGTNTWRLLGNHAEHGRTQVIPDPEDPGNMVLHLVATGATEHMHNHVETTFAGGETTENGREYEISFRAKWLGGSNQLNTRLYFNRLARTTLLEMPPLSGTPGAENSRFEANLGPTYAGFQHAPVVPQAGEGVTVSVVAADPDGIDAMRLWYAVDGRAWRSVAMTAGLGGLYTGIIPGQAAAAVVQFYVEGEDSLGAASTFPAAGADSRALYIVADGRARDGPHHNFRILMTAEDAAFQLDGPGGSNALSNHRRGATVVFNESEVYYDVGVRLKGSGYSRGSSRTGYNIRFHPDRLFHGVHDIIAVDRTASPYGLGASHRELVLKQIGAHAGGIPTMYDDLIYFIPPTNSLAASTAQLLLARYDEAFLDSSFVDGSDGTRFKFELIYYPTSTVDGNPQSPKPKPNTVLGVDIQNMGDDKEAYRWNHLIKNQRSRDDYSRIIDLGKTFSLAPGTNGGQLDIRSQEVMDVDQWLRAFAFESLGGINDTYNQGLPHNIQFFVRPEDNRVLVLPWDMDFAFHHAPNMSVFGTGSNFRKIITIPNNLHYFYGHLYDILSTTYNTAYLRDWVNHYAVFAQRNVTGEILNYISSRRAFVMGQLPGQVGFAVTTNNGQPFSVDDVLVTIEGNGWINVREIRLEGSSRPLEVTWTDADSWLLTVPIAAGENLLSFQAFDFQGNLVGTDRITVTSTVPARPLQEFLRITELNYNPYDPTEEELLLDPAADNDDFEFLELRNVGEQALDLAGVQFTDGIQFEFTARYDGAPVLITEVGTYKPDYVEIQNVSAESVATAGYFVVVNDANDIGHAPDINAWHQTRWTLPGEMAPGEVLYRSDDSEDIDHYWGEDIFFRTTGSGWVMLVDAQGRVADFVVWGYDPAEIASLRLDIDGLENITVDAAWGGAAVEAEGTTSNSLNRHGNSDHDDASDWAFTQPPSAGDQNGDLTTPFTGGRVDLDPGEFVIIVRKSAAFASRYGSGAGVRGQESGVGADSRSLIPEAWIAGEYTGKLSNGGERITLVDPLGGVILDFQYDDGGSWPGRADGKGASLELINPPAMPTTEPERTTFLEGSENWRSSGQYGGSPGYEGTGLLGDVLVNEVLSHTDWPRLDAIELHNPTGDPIDVGGWYLSDDWGWDPTGVDGNYKKFRIPDDTTIPALGYLVFDEDDFNPGGGAEPTDFALNGAHGDEVWLMEADASGKLTRFVDHVDFAAAAGGESWGRWPNGEGDLYPMAELTLGSENTGPRVGPVIISELHYNPAPGVDVDDLEFVEIYNATSEAIDLTNWRIRGGIDYNFPAGVSLDPFSPLLVVPFELGEAGKMAAFYEAYWPGGEVPDDLVILGGYSGQLDDEGQQVQLQRPDQPPLLEPGFIPRLLEDEVRYDDETPWPATPDGGGDSLHRTRTNAWGNTPSSFNARPPTPGLVEFPAEVVGRHIFYNDSIFDGNNASPGPEDDAAVAPDKEALLPGLPSGRDWNNATPDGRATFANYTSYDRGINGIMVDVVRTPPGVLPAAEDFRFRVGNDNDPSGWPPAPSPSVVTVRPGEGVGGSDRITLIWPDGAIQKQWLQVTVRPTLNTGLAAGDVFYFGNAIGETGNSTGDAKVNVFDMLGARDNQRIFLDPAPIDFVYDFNRDARVNTYDMLVARDNQTHFLNALRLITVPPSRAAPGAAAIGEARAHDAVLEEAGGPATGDRETSSARIAWLYEFEPLSRRQGFSRKDDRVDLLAGEDFGDR